MTQKVSILLSSYNGSKFIEEQLISIKNQTYPFELYIRDDGSTDNSVELIKKLFIKLKLNGQIILGKNIGAQKSFFYLIKKFGRKNNYIAFSDQDDIWEVDKLKSAVEKIKNKEEHLGASHPILYHSDLKIISHDGVLQTKTFWQSVGLNPNYTKLNNLLCQPTVTGCTVVVNKSLLKLIEIYPKDSSMHDYWLSILAKVFGTIISDKKSYINYRIHTDNAIGFKVINLNRLITLLNKPILFITNWKRNHMKRILQAGEFLNIYSKSLSNNDIILLTNFANLKNLHYIKRIYFKFKFKFHQQGILRNIISFFLF